MPTKLSSATAGNGGTTSSYTVNASAIAGRGMTAAISIYSSMITVTSVSQTNCVWSRAVSTSVLNSGTTEVWYCLSAGSSPGSTVTVALSGSNFGSGATVAVYDTPFTSTDQIATTSGTSATAPNTGTTPTTTNTNELFVGCISLIDTGGAGETFGTMSNSFSIVAEADFSGTSLLGPLLHHGSFQLFSSSLTTASTTAQFTSVNYTGVMATLIFGITPVSTRRRVSGSFI